MKKIIAWVLTIALTATAAIGGTLAYLTDRDSEANVFTVGNVSIDLEEDFEQGATLIPGVNIEKKPTITNTGANDAWVWAAVAIPAALDNDDASLNVVHFNYDADHVNATEWTWQDANKNWLVEKAVDINGVAYNVYTVLYQSALKPGETTPAVMTKVYMDTNVDIDPDGNWALIEDGVATPVNWNSDTNGSPIIYVSAYAMQTEGFETVYDAYDAYQTQWADNGSEWASAPVLVSTAAELRDAMKTDGAIIALKNDIIVTSEDTTGYGQHMFLANGKNCTIDLNSHNITVAEDASQVGSLFSAAHGGSITIEGNGNVEIKNGKAFIAWSMNDNCNINVYGGNFFGNGHEGNNALFYVQAGKIDVYGGKFTYPVADNDNWGFNARDAIGNNIVIEIHEGALLQHEAFQYGDNSRIQLEEGCELQEVTINGETWYKVVKQ